MESPFSAYLAKEAERRKLDSRPTVMFAMPHYGIAIHRLVYESHLAAVAHATNEGIGIRYSSIGVTNKMNLAAAQNGLIEYALAMKPDFVFITEQDMIIPNRSITHLMQQAIDNNLDIVSGVYFLRGSGEPCLYTKDLRKDDGQYGHSPMLTFPKDKLFEVGCCGFGCVLMRTSIFEKLDKPWFDDQEGKHGTDMYFYANTRRKGFKVWADSSLLVDQIDEDEPRMWGYADYKKWLKKKGGHRAGFIGNDIK